MNLYLLEMILKFLRMIFVAFISLFNITLYAENENIKENSIMNTNKYAVNKIVINENITVKNQPSTIEKTNVSLAEYTGRLTGYGPDCAGCSKVGNVACRTREKKSHSLINDGVYYTDKEYGKVRILAAATTKFKCGTIIVVTKPGMEPFTGIVLDTGGSMRKAWENGNVWMDLAYASETMTGSDKLTGKNIKFSVQRWGW